MKKVRHIVAMLLALSLMAALLAGCGAGGAQETKAEETKAEEAQGGETSTDVPTYTVATVRWTDAWPTDFLTNGVMAELEEKAGIKINWQVYYFGDWAEQKSLLLASGDLPDAFVANICMSASDVSQNKANLLDLTPYITEELMPNLTKAMAECPELKAICTSRDGKIWSLPKKLPLRPTVCGTELFINQDWLTALGLEAPTNIEELTEVMIAFGTGDPDGDGDPSNNYAITNAASKSLLSGDLRNILFPFGTMVSRDGNYMGLNNEGVPTFVPAAENYKQAVEWMHELWVAGALDPEYFTQESSAATAKRQHEGGAQVGLVSGWTADAEVGINVGQFTLLPSIEGYDGTHYVEAAANYLDISDREVIISAKCENPEGLLRWADGFYDDLVSMQTFYGSIPDQIKDNGDGTYELLVPADGTSLDTSAWSYSLRDFGPKYMNPDFYDKVNLPSDQGDGVKLALDSVDAQYVTNDKNCGLPMMQYEDAELERLTAIGTDLYTYVEAQYAHWVVDGGIEEEWDAYLEQLNAMGLEEYVGIHKTAYEAYKASMN